MISSETMSPAELAALLHFYADSGVEWMLEDAPVDRVAEFEQARATRQHGASAVQKAQTSEKVERPAAPASREAGNRPPAAAPQVAIPDEQAIADARFTADSARSLAELKEAMAGFAGCNLRNSARNLVFADGGTQSGIMIIGPMPTADDDKDGIPFSGKQGQMLDRMLTAIGLDRSNVLLTHVIPWRPPGNRVPSTRETEICRPFIERQIALAEPRYLLVLGNFAGRFFLGGTDTIHDMRGQWRDISVPGMAGGATVPTLVTLHPQDLMAAPASKRLAWQDLIGFRARIRA